MMVNFHSVAQAETASTVDTLAADEPPSGRFTWIIDNFSRLNTRKLYSDIFIVGGYKWYVNCDLLLFDIHLEFMQFFHVSITFIFKILV